MKTVKLLTFGIIILFITSCSKKEEEGDYLIFGHFYGECVGETCIETYKLTDSKLYEDAKDNYAKNEFEFLELGATKFQQVKDLWDFFPEKLLTESEGSIGCPDCTDGGGLFIRYNKSGDQKTWRIDQIKSNVPTYLHDFIDKVNEKISLINE